MKRAMLATALAFAGGACGEGPSAEAAWRTFKLEHGKAYGGPGEEAHRRAVFETNLAEYAALTARDGGAEYGADKFADLTAEEFAAYHGLQVPAAPAAPEADDEYYHFTDAEKAAAAKVTASDWRTKGAVTRVQNQGSCASCWSFSTVGNIEGQWVRAGRGNLTALSMQELIDCDHNQAWGCQGGWPFDACQWILSEKQGQVVAYADYHLDVRHRQQDCKDTSAMAVGAVIEGCKRVPKTEADLQTWVALYGPLSVVVDATTWRGYRKGIMSGCTGTLTNHAVLLVGFGTDAAAGKDYWLVKNSWGGWYGEMGYVRLERGTQQCGIQNTAMSAIIHAG